MMSEPRTADNWITHPATLAILGAIATAFLGGIGWVIVRAVEVDRSDLSVPSIDEARVTQTVAVTAKAPRRVGSRLLCYDAGQVALTLAHNQRGRRPIRIWRISASLAPASQAVAGEALTYDRDALGTVGHGVVDVERYDVYRRDGNLLARWVPSRDPAEAEERPPENLFGSQAFTLEPSGDHAHLDIVVHWDPLDPGLFEASLNIFYIVGDESRERRTPSVLIYQE